MGRGEYLCVLGIITKEDFMMKQKISNINKAAVMMITVISFLLFACSREDVNQFSDGLTTTISLNISMLSSSSKGTVEGSPEENKIHNLRVIILTRGGTSINQTFKDVIPGNPLMIENVPVGVMEMYVIANEAAIGKDYSNLVDLQDDVIIVNSSKKVLVKDESRTFFPKKGSVFNTENSNPETTKGLPMSWMNKTQTINPPQYDADNNIIPQNINVNLKRCVSKLKIIMQSTLTEDIIINEMNFGSFFGDRLYLFQEQSLDVPDDAFYVAKDYTGLNITIPANGEKILECYIYPSFAWKDPNRTSPYTIGFKTATGKEYLPQQFVNDYGALNSIARNKQVNITAKLSKHANIDIKFDVVDWKSVTVDVPSFN